MQRIQQSAMCEGLATTFCVLAVHTLRVLCGAEDALDDAYAQRVGMAVRVDFARLVLEASGVVFVLDHVLQLVGVWASQACGLKPKTGNKFAGVMAQSVYYTFTSLCALGVCWRADWFWPRGWARIMADGRVQQVPGATPYTAPAELKFLYCLQCAYYVVHLSLMLVSPRKKDHVQMALHHVVTLLLLVLSFRTGYLRVGTVVMFLHDVFDPFMLLAKCAHYCGRRRAANVLFACCVCAFAVPRLCLYPALIAQAWLGVCPGSPSCPGGVWDKTGVEFLLLALLCALLPIHVFWMRLLVIVLLKACKAQALQGDARSDSDDDTPDTSACAPHLKRD